MVDSRKIPELLPRPHELVPAIDLGNSLICEARYGHRHVAVILEMTFESLIICEGPALVVTCHQCEQTVIII